jgi:hypothetical protein
MNYFTSTEAVSIFPRTTFVHRKSYNNISVFDSNGQYHPWIDKYVRRGFSFVESGSPVCASSPRIGSRSILDDDCWVISFNTIGAVRCKFSSIRYFDEGENSGKDYNPICQCLHYHGCRFRCAGLDIPNN